MAGNDMTNTLYTLGANMSFYLVTENARRKNSTPFAQKTLHIFSIIHTEINYHIQIIDIKRQYEQTKPEQLSRPWCCPSFQYLTAQFVRRTRHNLP